MMLEQKIARLALRRFVEQMNDPTQPDPYVDGDCRDVLGEDQDAYLMAPRAGTTDMWEPFDFRKPGHWAAWKETRRTGRLERLMGYGHGCTYCWWFSREYRWEWQSRLAFWWHAHVFDHRRSTTGREQ